MNSPTVDILLSAHDLPDEWDRAAKHNFLKRTSLQAIERANPCGQLYYISQSSTSCSVAVSYQHRLDILAYGPGSLRLPVTIIGIPCSVGFAGYWFEAETGQAILAQLRTSRGALLILNSHEVTSLDGFAFGTTLPSCKLHVRWTSLDEYLNTMRSHYRYRWNKALEKARDLAVRRLDASEQFNEIHYSLYHNVYQRSAFKLERLPIDFFKTFPAVIDVFEINEIPVAFVQTTHFEDELIFMFGGLEYRLNLQYDLYLNMLLHIVRLGIEAGCNSIDLGQTAEGIKHKLGCFYAGKTLHATHSNLIANFLVQKFISVLSYRAPEFNFRVFK
ncbi:GNAT family N-acetyltransferase [candidate division KSB1 bacterium]|nr:GNAT family N-acetyltransferase [candidate division KSB1 bacterium]